MNSNILNSIFSWIENKSQNKYYAFYLGLLLMLCSWLLVCPNFIELNENYDAWQTVMLKSNDLTNSLKHISPSSWNAKKVFRLTIPFLMKIGNLSAFWVIILQIFVGYLLYVFSYKLALRILNDSVAATFITAGIAFLYFGRVAYYDINTAWFDAFAFFFLVMALYSKNIYTVFMFSTLAAWTDERAFAALSIVFIFHYFKEDLERLSKLRNLMKINKETIAVLLAILMYLVVRLYLSYQFDMKTPSDGANYHLLKQTLPFMKFGIWTFLEGFWMLYIIGLMYSLVNKNYIMFFASILPLFVLTGISGCVSDITRSGSYLVPMLFVSIYYLRNFLNTKDLRIIIFYSFTITLLFPATVVCVDWDVRIWFQSSSFVYGIRIVIEFLLYVKSCLQL